MREYTCKVMRYFDGNQTLRFDGNKHEAKDEEAYKYKVKDDFFSRLGIVLIDEDISNIKESQ